MSETAKNAVVNYFQESYQELKKVTWPTRNQAIRLTAIVLGFCVVASIVVGALDLGFNKGYGALVDYAARTIPPSISQPITLPQVNTSNTAPEVNKIVVPSTTQPGNTQQ